MAKETCPDCGASDDDLLITRDYLAGQGDRQVTRCLNCGRTWTAASPEDDHDDH